MSDETDVQVVFGAKIDDLISGVAAVRKSIEGIGDSAKKASTDSAEHHGAIVGHINQIRFALQGLTSPIRGVRESLGGLAEVFLVGFGIERVIHFVESMAELGSQTESTSAILGISIDKVDELSGIAKITGTNFEALTHSLTTMSAHIQRSTSDAFSPATQALNILGLKAKDLIGLPADQYFDRIADAVSRFNPSLNLTNALTAIGGRSMAAMIPILSQGREKFEEMRKAVRDAQVGLSAAIPGMAETHEKISLLAISVQSLGARVFSVLKPAFDWFIDTLTKMVQKLTIKELKDFATYLVDKVGNAIIDVTVLFYELGISIDSVITKMQRIFAGAAIGGTLGLFGGPVGGVAGAAIGGLTVGAWDALIATFSNGADKAKATVAAEENELLKRVQKWRDALKANIAAIPEDAKTDGKKPGLDAGAIPTNGRANLEASMKEMQGQIKLAQDMLEQKKILYDHDAANFTISESQKFQKLKVATQQEYETEAELVQKELALHGLTIQQRAELNARLVEMKAANNNKLLQLDVQMYAAERAQISGYVGTIESSWNQNLRGMLAGTTSVMEAMKQVLADFVIYAIEQFEKKFIFEQITTALTTAMHAGSEIAKTEATVAGVAARTAAEETGASVSIATYFTDAMASIGASVAKAFAAITAWLAPMFGPAAPAVAIGIAGGIAATAIALIPKYEMGTDFVPYTGLAVVHQGERIIPASQNTPGGGGGGKGGGGGTIHIHAIDGASVKRVFTTHADLINKVLTGRAAVSPV